MSDPKEVKALVPGVLMGRRVRSFATSYSTIGLVTGTVTVPALAAQSGEQVVDQNGLDTEAGPPRIEGRETGDGAGGTEAEGKP